MSFVFEENSPISYEKSVKQCFKILSRVCLLSSELLKEKENEEMGKKRKDIFS